VGEPAAPPKQSLVTLGWLNFLGMQTAFGCVPAAQEWSAKDIGFVLSIGGSLVWLVRCQVASFWTPCNRDDCWSRSALTVALIATIFRLWPIFPLSPLRKCCRESQSACSGRQLSPLRRAGRPR
jgi:hypothetical protein